MKKFSQRFIYGCALFAAIGLAPISRAEVVAPPSQSPQLESLRLPSFSIFGIEQDQIEDAKLNSQMPEAEMEKLLQAATEKSRGLPREIAKPDPISFVIPIVMFRSRRLFAQSSWSTQDIAEGQRISRFFARLTAKPELEIFSSKPAVFRDGLVNLRNWYADLCNRNSTLSKMMFTFDDGPYFGFPLPRERYSSLELIKAKKIPGRNEKFALFTDGKTAEPIFIGVLAPNGALKWAARFNKNSSVTINGAYLSDQFSETIDGYGFVCRVNQCRIYLDENLNLRFYFVSW